MWIEHITCNRPHVTCKLNIKHVTGCMWHKCLHIRFQKLQAWCDICECDKLDLSDAFDKFWDATDASVQPCKDNAVIANNDTNKVFVRVFIFTPLVLIF